MTTDFLIINSKMFPNGIVMEFPKENTTICLNFPPSPTPSKMQILLILLFRRLR